MSNRPAYVERKVAFQKARRAARRTHRQPCDCGYCLTTTRMEELKVAALARNPGAGEEVPF